MQTEKSQPSGQRIMPEIQKTSFTALSFYPQFRISLSASQTDVRFYLFCYIARVIILHIEDLPYCTSVLEDSFTY